MIALAGSAALTCGRPELATGAPLLRVRGEGSLRLVRITYEAGLATVAGSITDDARRQPLPGQRILLRVTVPNGVAIERDNQTDASGRFQWRLRLAPAVYLFSLSHRGSAHYAPMALERFVDLSKPTVELWASGPTEIQTGQRLQAFSVAARAAGRYLALPTELRVGQQLVTLLHTDARGPLQIRIPTRAFGRPGQHNVIFRFRGNEHYNAAEQRLSVVLRVAVTLSLRARQRQVAAGGTVILAGALRAHDHPIPHALVQIEAMGVPLLTTRTSATGNFSAQLPARNFPPGSLDLRAVFHPTNPWQVRARSPNLAIEIAPPVAIPLAHYLAPLGLTILSIGVGLAWRDRQRLRALLAILGRPRGASHPHRTAESRPTKSSGVYPSVGFQVLKHDFGLSATIWDPVDHKPIAGAAIELRGVDDTRLASKTSSEAGTFAFDDLPGGTLRLRVEKPGYLGQEALLQLPHRGKWRSARIELLPIRVRILELYRERALRYLKQDALWARTTPRELVRSLRQKPPGHRVPPSALAHFEVLSSLLERCYWSASPADPQTLQEAHEAATAHDQARSTTRADEQQRHDET